MHTNPAPITPTDPTTGSPDLHRRRSNRRRNGLLGGLAALVLLASACSDGNDAAVAADTNGVDPAAAAAPADQATPAPVDNAPATTAGPAALLARSPLGDILAGADGRTLYGFTNDVEAASTCYDACAEAWPPVIVDRNWTVGPNLDLGIFATTVRDDGSLQLVAGKWPLYYYVGDEALGDLNGQGSGDVWFAVAAGGKLITDPAPAGSAAADGSAAAAAAPAPIATATTDLGETLVDGDGLTLYGFTEDVDGIPSCDGACAEAWPPLLVDELPAGLDPTVFSLATRSDGSTQLVAGIWPLYRFAGDAAPGDLNGQGSGDVWFAVAPDGSLLGRNGDESANGTASVTAGGATVTADDSGVTVATDGY